MRLPTLLTFSLVWLLSLTVVPHASTQTQGASAQWSPAERAVWDAVDRGWQALRDENVEAFMASFHPEFLGWNMNRPAPLDVAAERQGTVEFLAQYDWESYTIEPVAIRIVGDVAIVHYRYHEAVRRTGADKVQREEGRATQVMRRLGESWKTLTIMSGPTPNE